MQVKNPAYRHGQYGTRIYACWNNMKQRCLNPDNKSFAEYGAAGVTVCDKWMDFAGFYEDMGPSYTDDLTIDRIDNTKGYSKENCRWVPRGDQNRNKRNIPLYDFRGEKMTLPQIAAAVGLKKDTLYARVAKYGWTWEQAISTPA